MVVSVAGVSVSPAFRDTKAPLRTGAVVARDAQRSETTARGPATALKRNVAVDIVGRRVTGVDSHLASWQKNRDQDFDSKKRDTSR